MSRIRILLALASFLLFVPACSGPFLLLPGGELEGEVSPVPADWSFTDEISTIQIEANPSDPYSVNIWATAAGEALYLHAGANRATWVEYLETDPRLRIKVEDRLYELAATRVTDAGEFAAFADRYETKYGNRPRNENVSEVFLLRLEAR